jgi:hypothetical protein
MLDFFTAEELVENYDKFRKLINKTFEGDRLESLNKMYDHFEERMIYTPASSVEHYHNAFPGGYIDHVLRVTRNALKLFEQQKEWGLDMGDLDKETIIFTALHHDLGKLGSVDEDIYIKNDSEWHVKNQGKIYKTNPNLNYMDHTLRSFYLLNYFGIQCSEEEWLGIQLTDGLYDENNKKYYITYSKDQTLKTPLPHIMHQADINAARYEYERWMKEMNPIKSTRAKTTGRPKKGNLADSFTNSNTNTTSVFDAFKGIVEE